MSSKWPLQKAGVLVNDVNHLYVYHIPTNARGVVSFTLSLIAETDWSLNLYICMLEEERLKTCYEILAFDPVNYPGGIVFR